MKKFSWQQILIYCVILVAAYIVISAVSGQPMLPGLDITGTETGQDAVSTQTAGLPGEVSVNDLPSEARDTLELIKSGGPYPYEQDGAIFNNYEGLLPRKGTGYYREYTVVTPGSSGRGARRIVAGLYGEYYYTDDHYQSFRLIKE